MVILILSVLFWNSYLTKKTRDNAPPIKEAGSEKITKQNNKTASSLVKFEDAVFPENFFFGSAYSDFQTAGISKASDWHEYIQNIKSPLVGPGIANDLFNRYQEDFDLAGEIGIQVHRISLDWARCEPEEGKFDKACIEKWKEIGRYMKSKGIQLMICLNHFPHPKWFAELGGWENVKAPYYYARYAEFIARNIGVPLETKWWLTYNEPQFVISIPYGKGGWPPFKTVENFADIKGTERFLKVAGNVMDGHRLAYRAIHKVMDKYMSKHNKVMIGFASAPGSFYPNDPNSDHDRLAENLFNTVHTLAFDSFVGNADRDFIGLNYYGRTKLKMHLPNWKNPLSWLGDKPFAIEWVDEGANQPDGRPKEFYPQALYDLIMKFKDMGKPIIITENGLDDDKDRFREEFLVIHLKAIHDAIRDGANVIGYQYWALADTWEPGDNRFSHMGLIRIERSDGTLNRSLRPSANTYAEIIRTRKITKDLLEKHK
ncbi:MAG: hypothetical protein A2649_00475 [Candidatus Yanofskybacteria bacterium RIFCSPHIGHO2_01_FULL_41_26]|uniref:Glycoside hydrolase family 1 n=1 Tax=Candidatus Yanofskybacteria bacterium RIFCSPHIGHO2_01_FULL_41_26 TaxID=1802661 RepID=A0A1F8ECJ0_9BACT|nr:MAG: hypothetical protein A2649_00475 [Candidatus Yanofskybacteria bacterium RIFCSPHIGHO2_01_FULL_41_26]